MGQKQGSGGIIIQTEEGPSLKAMIFGWTAIVLGIGVAVSAVVLSTYLGLALTLVGAGLGTALTAVGVGEGVKRARIGDAYRIEAKARMIEARDRWRLLE